MSTTKIILDENNTIQPQAHIGYVFILKSILIKHYKCNCSFVNGEKSYDCSHAPCLVNNSQFKCIEVLLNIIGTDACEGNWRISDGDVRLVDNDGYVYTGKIICQFIDKQRHRTPEGHYVAPRTQAEVVYTFNTLSEGKEISEIQIVDGRKILSYVVKDRKQGNDIFSSDYYASIAKGESVQEEEHSVFSRPASSIDYLIEQVNRLKVEMYKRLHNTMTSTEKKLLEERIETEIYSLKLRFNSRHAQEPEWIEAYDDFMTTVADYQQELERKADRQESLEMMLKKVSDLLSMNPYQFEHLCGSLLEQLGFHDIVVTQKSNDKGVDVIASKDGEKYVVQCKRYKSMVGSPDMQTFIGAMKNEGAERGVFITTSGFSREAELMAESNNIELIDKNILAKLLSLTDDSAGTFSPTLF